MKIFLGLGVGALLAVAVARGPAAAASPGATAPVDDPPIECPLCGGNVRMHGVILDQVSALSAEFGRRALVALLS